MKKPSEGCKNARKLRRRFQYLADFKRSIENNRPESFTMTLGLVMSTLDCPVHDQTDSLASTKIGRKHLRSLHKLWVSLDRPMTGIWAESKVYVNRLLAEHKRKVT